MKTKEKLTFLLIYNQLIKTYKIILFELAEYF
jgi:hypothetical protein